SPRKTLGYDLSTARASCGCVTNHHPARLPPSTIYLRKRDRTMNTKTTRLLSAGALIAAVALTGCASGSISGGTNDTATDAQGETNKDLKAVTIGLFPSSAVGAIQLGIDKGYFEEEGIDLEMLLGQGSAAQL